MKEYKKYLDGIRAIAILSVIIYHARIDILGTRLLPGGYLGVDIFFVISGYLIAYVIYRDFKLNKSFFILNFLDRRIRRIFPVVIITFILFYIPFFLTLISSSFESYIKSVNSFFLFNTNFYFSDLSQSYGDESSLEKPFLHLWSIALEFQFYFFAVIFFFISFNFFKNFITTILIIIFTASLIFAEINFNTNAISNFYLPFGRIWEFIFGILLFLIDKKNFFFKKKEFYSFFPILGFFIIIFSFFYFDHNSRHPSLFTIFPLLGLTLIILFQKHNNLILNILNFNLINKIGIISFSLYVFHLPLFALTRLIFDKYDNSHLLLIVKISIPIFLIIISFLSYNLIEIKFRNQNIFSHKKFYLTLSILSLLILSLNFYTLKNNSFDKRWIIDGYSLDKKLYIKNFTLLSQKYEKKIDLNNIYNANQKNVLIIGNSFANDLFVGLKINNNKFKQFNFHFLESQIRCIPSYIKIYINDLCYKSRDKFKNLYQNEFLQLLDNIDKIIIYSRYYETDIEKLGEILDHLKSVYNKKIIIVNNPPLFTGRNRFGTIYWYFLDDFVFENKRIPTKYEIYDLEKKYFTNLENNFFKIQKKNKEIQKIANSKNIEVIDLYNFFCNEKYKRCRFFTNDNELIFRDYGHFTLEGLNFFLESELFKIINKLN